MGDKVVNFPKAGAPCDDCRWCACCLIGSRDRVPRDAWAQEYTGTKSVSCGTTLFEYGAELTHLHVLRSGSAKSYIRGAEGCEEVVMFHYPGDGLGFEAVGGGTHVTGAVALETASVCTFAFPFRRDAAARLPALWGVAGALSARTVGDRNMRLLLVGKKSVKARLAAFLVWLAGRYHARGCSGSQFNLTMSRFDIASYLAMAVETLSRQIGELEEQGVLRVERRLITITAAETLRAIAAGPAERAVPADESRRRDRS